MESRSVLLADAAATQDLGRQLAQQWLALPTGERPLLLLQGDLGAGKTCLTQGLAAGLGIAVLPVAAAQPLGQALGLRLIELSDTWVERELLLGGQQLTVREYGNVEWLRLLPAAEPLVASMAAALQADAPPTYEDALQVIARHIDGLCR